MVEIEPWYKEWFNSPYYHQLYFKRDEKEAADFIDKLVLQLNPEPMSKMLDIACGKGRHSVQLASKEFDVTGIDLSEESIQQAKNCETINLNFFVHDMRLPFNVNYFDYAFNFFTSFGYFDSRREHNNAIRTIAQSLKKGGLLVIDYLNVQYAELHSIPESQIEIEDVVYSINKWSDEEHFYKKIVVDDKIRQQSLEHLERVAKFTLGDFTKMLGDNSLKIQKVFGDYEFGEYDLYKSPRLIIFAEKTV